jgi:DDE superfamily endonuclease
VARRVWALKGQRPTRCGRQRFQSLYVYGFCRPATGRNLCLLLPKANAELMGEALAEFARWADPEGRKVLVVLVDNAGAHVAKALRVPANVRLFRLPPCTPELQPAEHLWPLVREALANRDFDHLVGLAGKLRRRCDWLAAHPEAVQGTVGFHWAVNL